MVSFFTLDQVVKALTTTRILIQFIGQIAAVHWLRMHDTAGAGFQMALYPLPSVVALVGWIYIFTTSGTGYIAGGLATLAAGIVAFFVWSRWPPASARAPQAAGRS